MRFFLSLAVESPILARFFLLNSPREPDRRGRTQTWGPEKET